VRMIVRFLTRGLVQVSECDMAAGRFEVSGHLMNSSRLESRSSPACGLHRIVAKQAPSANETRTNDVEIMTNCLKLLESL
jgi:hypothetical protein